MLSFFLTSLLTCQADYIPVCELCCFREMSGFGCEFIQRALLVKGQVRDAERNLRSYFRVFVIRAVSKARTDAARWCAGRSNKYWQIPVVLPKSKGHRSERTSCQSSLSNVCPLLFCVFVCVSVRVSVAIFYSYGPRT
jgi:hypothetical protein